jgi:hypothetical protein
VTADEVLQRQVAAWNAGDIEAFCADCAGDVAYVGAAGVTRGRAAVAANYARAYPDRAAMGRLSVVVDERRVRGDVVTMVVKWRVERESGEIGGNAVLVWERGPEGWKLAVDATFVVAIR